MDVILHLGAHRTATTSLQSFLGQNEEVLGQAGITVWGPQVTRSGLFAGLTKRPEWLNDADACQERKTAAAIRLEIDRLEEAGTRTLLISEENFLGTMPHCLEQETLYPDAGARVRRLVSALGPHLTGLALSIRRYDTWWASLLADQRARGRATPRDLRRLVNHPRGWKRVVQILREEAQGRPLVVWPFETMVGRNAAQLRAALSACTAPPALPEGLYDHGRVMNAKGRAQLSPFSLAERGALAARYLADLDWLSQPRAGLRFIEKDPGEPGQDKQDQGLAGADPFWPTAEEGWVHDHEERRLGEARSEGAA